MPETWPRKWEPKGTLRALDMKWKKEANRK